MRMMNNGINKTDRLCLSYVTEDTGGDDNFSDDDDIEDDMLEFNSNTDHNDNQIDDEDDEDDNEDEDDDWWELEVCKRHLQCNVVAFCTSLKMSWQSLYSRSEYFQKNSAIFLSKVFFFIISISVMITSNGQEHTGKDAKISIDDYFHIEDQKEWTFYIGSKYVS